MPGSSGSILSMALSSGPVVGGVLFLLIACSVGCWGVILFKYGVLRRASRESREFLRIFWSSATFHAVEEGVGHLRSSPLAEIFRSGYAEWRRFRKQGAAARDANAPGDLTARLGSLESVERSLRQALESETARLERMLIFLATVASAAPFVGLFGTVWGIMESFRDIGVTGSANLAVVAPGISEALIATATGLVSAIPAVVAYNYFNDSIETQATDMEAFVTEFLNIVARSRGAGGA